MSVSQIDDTSKVDARSILNFLDRVQSWQPTGWMFIAISEGDGERFRQIPINTNVPFREHLLAIIEKYAHRRNLYFCPTIFKVDERKRKYAYSAIWLHCDIDGGDPNDFAKRPSVLWETSPKRYQALWKLDHVLRPRDAEACNRALAQHSEDGTGWEITKYLRVPHTFNFKPSYHRPRVRLLRAEWDLLKGWKPERATLPALADTPGDIDWRAVRELNGAQLALKYRAPISAPARGGDRSDTWMWIARIAIDNGASDEEVAAIMLRCRRTFRSRFPDGLDDVRAREEIERLCSKLRNKR
jgi:hypothetical protein